MKDRFNKQMIEKTGGITHDRVTIDGVLLANLL
jgi:hypothetical protein